MREIWKTVSGYNGRYEVSNFGNVRSLASGTPKLLKQMTNAGKYNGYAMVTLYSSPNCGVKVKVHRLVAEAFIPNPELFPVINHKDENKLNNSVANLEWCTRRYNTTYGTSRERAVRSWKKTRAGA